MTSPVGLYLLQFFSIIWRFLRGTFIGKRTTSELPVFTVGNCDRHSVLSEHSVSWENAKREFLRRPTLFRKSKAQIKQSRRPRPHISAPLGLVQQWQNLPTTQLRLEALQPLPIEVASGSASCQPTKIEEPAELPSQGSISIYPDTAEDGSAGDKTPVHLQGYEDDLASKPEDDHLHEAKIHKGINFSESQIIYQSHPHSATSGVLSDFPTFTQSNRQSVSDPLFTSTPIKRSRTTIAFESFSPPGCEYADVFDFSMYMQDGSSVLDFNSSLMRQLSTKTTSSKWSPLARKVSLMRAKGRNRNAVVYGPPVMLNRNSPTARAQLRFSLFNISPTAAYTKTARPLNRFSLPTGLGASPESMASPVLRFEEAIKNDWPSDVFLCEDGTSFEFKKGAWEHMSKCHWTEEEFLKIFAPQGL